MATEIYGASDDLIEFDGDIHGEYADMRLDKKPALVILSDGSVLEVKYGKPLGAIWKIELVHKGPLFEKIDVCLDEDADRYSDTAYFNDGLKWAYVAGEWERVK